MSNSIYFILGLCMKSGNLLSGEFQCEKAVKKNKAKLVIIAKDASLNTKNYSKINVIIEKFQYMNLVRKNSWERP